MLYVKNVSKSTAEVTMQVFANPHVRGFRASDDGKLYALWLPDTGNVLRVPAGHAVELPADLGARCGSRPDFGWLTEAQFYSRGRDIPDGYALVEQNALLAKQVTDLEARVARVDDLEARLAKEEASAETLAEQYKAVAKTAELPVESPKLLEGV